MPRAKLTPAPTIPQAIAKCWKDYAGLTFDNVVAVRSSADWFAVLIEDKGGNFHAVDFNIVPTAVGHMWDVSNDYIHFDSKEQFEKAGIAVGIL